MSVSSHVPNVPQIETDDATDAGLRQVIERAKVTKSPPPQWYRTMGNNPEVAKAFRAYWDLLHRGGTVPHEIKELARIQIAQMIGCEFCARQISPLAAFCCLTMGGNRMAKSWGIEPHVGDVIPEGVMSIHGTGH